MLISEIKEVGADIGEPDCKMVNPYIVGTDMQLEPYLLNYSLDDEFMISSDKILTLAEPIPTLLEKYLKITKE
tara:strand:+ start:1587 stop:1805 length:219 start_codon:yes stop_codon:yes gene_type:complete